MTETSATQFSHVKPGDTDFEDGGLRGFFQYRDLGIADATNGKVVAHLVRAVLPPTVYRRPSNVCREITTACQRRLSCSFGAGRR